MLRRIFGEVREQYRLPMKAHLCEYTSSDCYVVLKQIYLILQSHRGHMAFVRARNLSPVDYYLPSRDQVVEYDETQHFTAPRALTIRNYPPWLKLAYDTKRWLSLCKQFDRHDSDPIFRDEQRAWYDTLRDFAPVVLGMAPTSRILWSDHAWCSLKVSSTDDVERFIRKAHLGI
jgi:hypothetical protein